MSGASLGGMITFFIEIILFRKFLSAIFGGWYNTLIMRGGTSRTYILSLILCDFGVFVIFSQGFFLANVIYGIDPTGW